MFYLGRFFHERDLNEKANALPTYLNILFGRNSAIFPKLPYLSSQTIEIGIDYGLGNPQSLNSCLIFERDAEAIVSSFIVESGLSNSSRSGHCRFFDASATDVFAAFGCCCEQGVASLTFGSDRL